MRSKSFYLALVIVLSFFIISCDKEEGEGGTSTIAGKILVRNYNSNFTIIKGEYYAPDVDVFIIYGNDSIHADDFKTSIGGWYRFEFLNKGEYTIYAISDDATMQSPSGKTIVKKTIEISENNSTVIVDDIVIFD